MAETRGSLPKMTVSEPTANPVPVVIYCPACQSLHIDEGEWATRPHKTHQCQKCKLEWRPFPYATVGVASRKHYHKAMYDDLSGVLLEDCAICGESWRSTDVHISNPSVAEPKTLAANCSQIARAEPSRGAPSWSKMMAEMQPCGHTNAQHLYHDSGDIKIDLSACLVHTSIEHAGQTSGGTTADVAKAASAAPEPGRGAPDAALGTCRTPHFLGEPTPDRKALTQIPHYELPQGLCRDWQAIDRVAATKEPQSKGQDGSPVFMQTNTAPVYMCPVGCGCLWRDNQDGTMSLYGPNSKSCEKCEYMPLKELIPLDRASGHVVLLEALRAARLKLFYIGNLATNAHFDQANLEPVLKRIVAFANDGQAEAEAAIQQAERT